MTLTELYRKIIDELSPSLGANEAKATARLLFEDDLGVTPAVLALRGDRVLEPETITRYGRFISQIKAGEPPQYIIGSAHFMGMDLKVTPATLIPRPETAGLVDMIVDDNSGKTGLHVCDLGTGSGCIAIAMSRALPFAEVDAVDISDDALAVARENAAKLMCKINFIKADILDSLPLPAQKYDIIVSNPPYITEDEKKDMETRVKDYEPAQALFVPDNDPLRFYKAIADYALGALSAGGSLYFEINPLFAGQLTSMMADKGFSCDISRDAYGKNRFAVCRR